ncbi:MAG: arylsulfatase [Gemmataceae bacterium]
MFARCMTVSLMLMVLSYLPSLASGAAKTRPNVIIVMTDDQGYGEFSCHGNPIAKTPNIDRLAAQSIRLTDFHVAPMCTPTRSQLMTGLDAFRNGAVNVSSGRTLLRPELKTLADILKAAGYRTGIFGKWHLGDNYPFRPEDRGFEEAIWFPSSHINSVPDFWDNDYFNDTYIHNGKRQKYKGYCTDVFFREAMRWLKQPSSPKQPFLAYLPLNAPHGPLFVPNKYRGPIRKAIAAKPEVVKHLTPRQRKSLVSFLAMGANIDENIGKLERFLVTNGLRENTILVFLTDNGSTMGHRYYNAGMRGNKTTLWEGGHRVPCFLRWPSGRLGPARDVAELSQVQDLLPTLADLVGVKKVPDNLDGRSLVPVLRGEKKTLGDRMLVINYSRMPQFKVTYTKGNPAIPQRDGAAVLWGPWRLLENRELYNVREDPHQDHDVAAQHPKIVSKMRTYLNKWWDGVKDRVKEPQRVIIGSEAENPMMLTACEWLDVFVDQQGQIRSGVQRNGTWYLKVARSGKYEFELRRWPRERAVGLDKGLPQTKVTDGVYRLGKAIPIASAQLRIGRQLQMGKPDADGESVRFTVKLRAGLTTLMTTFLDAQGRELCGAYYVYVCRK